MPITNRLVDQLSLQLERARDVVVNHGFNTVVSGSVWSIKEQRMDKYPLVRLLDKVQSSTHLNTRPLTERDPAGSFLGVGG
jgi:hypothetical protein